MFLPSLPFPLQVGILAVVALATIQYALLCYSWRKNKNCHTDDTMSSLNARLADPGYRYWVKAALCIQYLKEGLEKFVEDKSREVHDSVLKEVQNCDNILVQGLCTDGVIRFNPAGKTWSVQNCTCQDCTRCVAVIEHHVVKSGQIYLDPKVQELHDKVLQELGRCGNPSINGTCAGVGLRYNRLRQNKWEVTNCTCHRCQIFIDELSKYRCATLGLHQNTTFTFKQSNFNNSDIQQWHTEHWQLAKLFMNPGQGVATISPRDTDISGLINFIENCDVPRKEIHNTLSIKKCRKGRNTIIHTAAMSLIEADFLSKTQDMIDLLSDPKSLVQRKESQDAINKIEEVTAADFHITKENEDKILKELATELKCLSKTLNTNIDDLQMKLNKVETNIGQKMKAQHDKLEKELQDRDKDKQILLQEMKAQQDRLENKLQRLENKLQDKEKDKEKLEKSLQTLEQKIKGDGELVRMLGKDMNEIKISLEKNRQDIDKNRQDIDKNRQDIDKNRQDIDKNRQDIDILITKTVEGEREREQLKQKVEQADMAADSKKVKETVTEEDKKQLQQYLVKGYEDSKLDVPTLHSCHALPIGKIFAPVVLISDREFLDQERGRGKPRDSLSEKLRSYTELFFKEGNLQKRIFLLGKAGAGKTTLCKHLTDIWCNNSVSPQFKDAEVLKLFRYLFHVSCRFAEASESIFDMICNQLIGENDKMIEVARQVLKNTPYECLVLVDGIDEWKGSVNMPTGRRGDIPGLPSRKGLEDCVVLSTSRPERIHMLSTKLDKTCSVLELHGIQVVSQLICDILREAEYPDPLQSCSEFLSQVVRSNLTGLIQLPLMLINALNLWETNENLSDSMCVNYSNMVEGLFLRAKDAKRIEEHQQERRQETSAEQDANRIEEHDQKRRKVISVKLPDCFRQTDWCKRHAGLLIKLGELAFDLLFGNDQNLSLIFSEKQIRKYLTETELKICLAVGILSKAQTISRSNRKNTSFSFCHKTFQEFLGALWLSREQFELMSIFRNTDTLFDNVVFIQFLCGMSPITGIRFWQYIAEEVTEKDEQINEWRLGTGLTILGKNKVLDLQRLVLQCINEARNADLEQHQQLYYFIPDIYIGRNTDERDITLINGMVEKCVADIKSVTLYEKIPSDIVKSMKKMQSAISIRLQGDRYNNASMPELQFPDQLKLLYVMWVNIPSAIKFPKHLTSLTVWDSKLSHSGGIEQLCSCLRVSSTLRYLYLRDLSCSDHGDRCSLPALDLQTHHSLEKVELRMLSVESVLLPGQGAIHLPITSLIVGNITLSHNAIEQLCSWLSVSSTLRYLHIASLSCSNHGDRCCLPALDLQTHHSLEEVRLSRLSVESVLLPGQLERQQASDLHGVPSLGIYMCDVNMSSQGWRSWRDSLPHLPYRLKVVLWDCNIDEVLKSYIRSCSHFTVTMDDTRTIKFWFETKQGQ